jgi:hypothetical protein
MRRSIPWIVVGVGTLVGLWLAWPEAEPAPARASVVPPSAVAPPDVPATEAFLKAAALSAKMPNLQGTREALARALLPKGPPPDDAREAWRPFAESIAAIEAAVARPGLTIPDEDPDATSLPVIDVQRVIFALLVRGWDRALSGQPGQPAQPAQIVEGVADMLHAYAFGVRIVDAGESLLDVAVGVALQAASLRELGELLDASGPASGPGSAAEPAHRAALAGLLKYKARGSATARVVPRDCAALKLQTAKDMAEPGAMLRYTQLEEVVDTLGVSPTVANAVVSAAVYDPVDTRAQIDAACLAAMMRLAEGRPPVSDVKPLPPAAPVGPQLLLELFDNPAGHAAAWGSDRGYSGVGAREASIWAAREVLTTVVAARLYLWTSGKAPTQVSDLVPAWLPTEPVDPYNPEGLRIVDGVVRSAGQDVPDRPHADTDPRLAIAME